MSAASALVNRKFKITSRDATNVTLTQDGEAHGAVALPAVLTIAHGGNTAFWGPANGPERYTIGIDRGTA